MTVATPRVSILIPVYNRADCIEATLASALGQTVTDLEVVVVDNCSSDASWELIQAVASRDARVRAFRNDSNIGPVRNWRRCVQEARGEFGKILWSDDLLHPEFLAQALAAMADPRVGFVYSPALLFTGDDPLAGRLMFDAAPAGARPCMEFIEGVLLQRDYPVSPGCALFRLVDMRDCLLEQVPNRVNSDFSMHAIGNDLLLFLLVAARYPCFFRLAAPLSYFRDHPGSISVSSAPGKLQLHYDIAKAWFVAGHALAPGLVARFNALLLLDLVGFRHNQFGLRRVDDFYPATASRPLAWGWLPWRIAFVIQRRLRRQLGVA